MKKLNKIIYFLIFYICFINCGFGVILPPIPTRYRITGLSDSDSSYTPGVNTGDLVIIKTVCIYKQGGENQYRVTATSANANGTIFRVYDGISEYVPYDVVWHDTIDQTGISANLDSGVNNPTLFSNPAIILGCPNGDTASFIITFTQDDIGAVTSGTYNDTLSITIGGI